MAKNFENRDDFEYADVEIMWRNTGDEISLEKATIKRVDVDCVTEDDPRDEDIFFYVHSWEDMDCINTDEDFREDFIIKKVIGYYNW